MLPVAIRVWLTALGGLLISNTDQFFIATLEGAEALPSYRAAFLLVLNLHLLAGVFSGASNVFVSHLWQAGKVEQIREILRRNALIGLLAISCGGAAILGMGADLFDLWLGRGHYIGNEVMLIILVTFLLEHHATVFSTCARATNDEAYAWSSLIAGGVKICLGLWLTRAFGLVGLAFATLIAQTVTNNWFMVHRSAIRLGVSLRIHFATVVLSWVLVSVFAGALTIATKQVLAAQPLLVRMSGIACANGILLSASYWLLVLNRSQRVRFTTKLGFA